MRQRRTLKRARSKTAAGGPPKPAGPVRRVANETSMAWMLERVRREEAMCHADLMRARTSDPAMVMLCSEQYLKAAEQRRKIEKDFARIGISQGDAIPREDVEAADREAAEIIRSDLGFGLPSTLATQLSGKVFTPAQVKDIVVDAVREMVGRWHKGGQTTKEAVP